MTSPLKFRSFRTLSLATVLMALPVTLPSAEEPKKTAESPKNPGIFNVDFPGGSIEQLVKSIAAGGDAIFNLVGEKADLAVQVPAFSLRNAESESLANALNQMLGAQGLNVTRAQGAMFSGSRGQTNFPIYVLIRRNAIDRPAFDSFQLGPYLEKQSIDDIVMAIRTLWELNPANKPEALQLKFHPPTKLLLASGTPEAIAVASRVISTLSGPVVDKPAAEKKRLEAVANEVSKRRQTREKLEKSPPEPTATPPAKR